MKRIDKKNTYMYQFEQTSKYQYQFVAKAKWISWTVMYLICLGVQNVFALPAQIMVAIAAGILSVFYSNVMESPWFTFVMYTLSTGMTIMAFFVFVRFIEKRPFKTIGFGVSQKLMKYLKGVGIAVAMQLIYFFTVLAVGYAEVLKTPEHATNGMGTQAIGFVVLFLLMFLIQGASEEVAVRGWLLPVLSRHYSIPVAVFLSSLLFGLIHLLNPNVGLLPLLNLILFGIFASLYAIYDDGLWGICAIHSIWNWFMGNILGLPVSGMILGGASIIETKVTGPEIITGGAFGPEGGLIVTAMLVVASIVTWMRIEKEEVAIEAEAEKEQEEASYDAE